jgi:hypothetical protein
MDDLEMIREERRKELKGIKNQRDSLAIRNIELERENTRLTERIKELEDAIEYIIIGSECVK